MHAALHILGVIADARSEGSDGAVALLQQEIDSEWCSFEPLSRAKWERLWYANHDCDDADDEYGDGCDHQPPQGIPTPEDVWAARRAYAQRHPTMAAIERETKAAEDHFSDRLNETLYRGSDAIEARVRSYATVERPQWFGVVKVE